MERLQDKLFLSEWWSESDVKVIKAIIFDELSNLNDDISGATLELRRILYQHFANMDLHRRSMLAEIRNFYDDVDRLALLTGSRAPEFGRDARNVSTTGNNIEAKQASEESRSDYNDLSVYDRLRKADKGFGGSMDKK